MLRLAADLQNLAAAVADLAEGTTAAAEVMLGLAADLDNKVGNLVAAALLVVVVERLLVPLAVAELGLPSSRSNNRHY